MSVLKLGGAVIVLEVAGTAFEVEEAGSVSRRDVGYAVGPALMAMDDEEKPFSMLLRRDDAPTTRVELANGSTSYPKSGNKILRLRLDCIPDCRFLLSPCHCKRLVGSAETIDRSSAKTRVMVKSILQRAVVAVWVNEHTKIFENLKRGGLFR